MTIAILALSPMKNAGIARCPSADHLPPPTAAENAAWGPAISQLTRAQTTVTAAWPSTTLRASRRARAKSIATKFNPVERSSRTLRLLCQKWPAHYREAALVHQGVLGLFCAYR